MNNFILYLKHLNFELVLSETYIIFNLSIVI